MDFYPPLDVGDPKVFITGIVALFAKYPEEVTDAAVEPLRGIPSRLKTLSSLAAIKEICDEIYDPIARRMWREELARQPRALPRPPRTPEQQQAIDAQIAKARAHFGTPEPKGHAAPRSKRDSGYLRRVSEQLAHRKASLA